MAPKRPLKDQSTSMNNKRKKKHSPTTHPTPSVQTMDKSKKWACELCGAAFNHRGNLNQHKLTHQERRFKCSFGDCGKAFCRKNQLTRHKTTHSITNIFPFVCEVEGCGFKSKLREYVQHHKVRVHDSFGRYKCNICDHRFAKKRKLKEHSFDHTGVYPYDCPSCEMKFPTNRGLRRHFETRHGNPKHICAHCQQRFRKFTELRKHLTTEHKGIVCCFRHAGADQVCGMKFKTTAKLMAHVEEIYSKKQARADKNRIYHAQTSLCTVCGNIYTYIGMRTHDCGAVRKRNMTYRGVHKENKHIGGWVARITHQKVQFYLGRFNTAEEAARAYDIKATKLLGKRAQLNFRPEVPPRSAELTTMRKKQPGGEKNLRATTSTLKEPRKLAHTFNKLIVVPEQESFDSEVSDYSRDKKRIPFSFKNEVISQSGTSCSEFERKPKLVFSIC